MRVTQKISRNASMAVLGMSLLAGFGVVVVVIALAVGVIQDSAANSDLIGLLVATGGAFFLIGAVGWFGLTQPHRHFDDINVPMAGNHHSEHADQHDQTSQH